MKIFLLVSVIFFCSCEAEIKSRINGERCIALVQKQIDFGPRLLNSPAAKQTAEWIAAEAKKHGWSVVIDEWTEKHRGKVNTYRNVICTLAGESDDFILLGSHYDTKTISGKPNFVSANDGGSSTALLLELMSHIPKNKIAVRAVFFDGEECEVNYSNNDGLHGSRRYATQLVLANTVKQCKAMILLDMIGDKDLHIAIPANGDKPLKDLLMKVAKKNDWGQYFSKGTNSVLDDHVPFVELGVPAIDLIDFSYGPGNSYWHTEKDTIDKLSPKSFQIVGELTLQVLEKLRP
ncbi:M28 family metallopeptidase [Lentisphaera profundi]|uniref:M28 family metallopeptidase n=1 Tax=Lentisphaera profundi TaxID=1658616 RepID=A0ABY7VZV1_9BACT|nr:M28 family metallopeptidase [Lentisphaera profundi]WDE98783.1 M28 family metallopeptidase [Lentisphaera profundi]